ncbi:uncharacterized protein LOC132308899 [Cornus florida]|uniref:uncharacterized protein LOC132308899 n=1 Tax=Cornus florida TaxID=4283 RepID=UPI00289BF3A6|nr:uncharacterized protein LOC132308899 [Cornus florida]
MHMAGAKVRIPVTCRQANDIGKYCGGPESGAIMIFGFLEGEECLPESQCNSGESNNFDGIDSVEFDDDNSEDENVNNVEENKAFWESKDQLLRATLCRSSSIESKIRQATKEALRELKLAGVSCSCRRAVVDGCRDCLQREISDRLRVAGYNCAICKSKWRSSPHIISGEHTYLEVVDPSNPKKGEVRVVIELNFRAEFEVARASEEYNRLISRLPEVFVGKAERLRGLIKILCSAAKKCMKDNKMHMGPWRKHKHMQAKWIGACERTTLTPIQSAGLLNRRPKPRASMLTFDLVGNSAVKVV